MPLTLVAAHHTATGPRERNEDFAGFVTPHAALLATKGFTAVIADGVSGAAGGREAAEHCARNVLADFYSTPDTWEVSQSLDKIYAALNRWVEAQGRAGRDLVGMATTLTTLVLRGDRYSFAHVGDTRLYLWRGGNLQQLTTDHVWQRPEMEHVLTRAVGLDRSVVADHGFGPLQVGDVFALLSDGAWGKLAQSDLGASFEQLKRGLIDAAACARSLVDTALKLGGTDNASVVVVRVDAVDTSALRDMLREQQALPVPPKLKAGDVIDGMTVQGVLHESRITRLYKVQRGERILVLKTLTEQAAADAHERLAFAHEAWLAKRVVARYFAQFIEADNPNDTLSTLYFLSTFHSGKTLAAALLAGQHYTVPEALKLGMELARALGALHRRSIIHRDVKPDNLHLGDDGQLRLLDLGVATSGFDVADISSARRAGTPSFLAPELFAAEGVPSVQSDVYAWGVTVYFALTRHYPFGEIEPFQTPRFGDATPPSRHRPEVPGWFENCVMKALAVAPGERFETAEELHLALEQGPLSLAAPQKRRPLATRNALRTWQFIAIAALLGNLAMLYLLVTK
jgi:serine/threonine protein phosphatase PrpC